MSRRRKDGSGPRVNGALLDVESGAEYLGATKPTVRHWIDRGFIPSLKIGGRVLLRRAALDAHLQKLERKASRGPEAA